MNRDELYSSSLTRYVRYGFLIFPVLFTVYGLADVGGLVTSATKLSPIQVFFLSLFWLVLGTLQYFYQIRTTREKTLRLVSFYLLTIATLIGYVGLSSDFTMMWVMLMFLSYLLFYRIGVIINVIVFSLLVFFDTFYKIISLGEFQIQNIISLFAIFIGSLVMLSIDKELKSKKNELKLLRSSESVQKERVFTIINNITDAVISTDKDGVVELYNASALNLLDTNKSLIGKKITNILRLHDLNSKPFKLLTRLKETKSSVTRDDLFFNYSPIDIVRLEITYAPIRSTYFKQLKTDAHDGYILLLRDITKSKNLEEERDEFISVVSHELRTPIAISEASISNLQLLLNHTNATKAMIQDSAETAHEQIVFLARMVNDLSALSRAERNVGGEKELISLNDLANKLYHEYEADARKKKLKFNLDLSANLGTVTTSRLYLEELIQNFITNAIKYTKVGSVTLSMKKQKNKVIISVHDTGIGISKSDQSKIFGKFYRSEDFRTRETSGTGLGLYVANKLAQKIGVKIDVVSRLNFGSTFSIAIDSEQ